MRARYTDVGDPIEKTMLRVLRKNILIWLAAVWCMAGRAATQTPNSAGHAPEEPMFQAKASLVQVPVFVFAHDGLERGPKPDDWKCVRNEWAAFQALSADRPFLPKGCSVGEVKDLTLDDFRLFQDAQQQTIKSVEKETWPLCVRDNRTWHFENSYTSRGIWSSDDVGGISPDGGSIFPDTLHFYLVGYTPAHTSSEGACHRIRVEVRRPEAAEVFSRDEYCTGQTPSDLLNGTKTGNRLEHELAQKGKGKIPLSLQAGAFRLADGRPLLDVVVEFPWKQLNHQWDVQTGRLYASISVLGAVYTKEGRLVSRFSDLLWPSYWPTVMLGWQFDNAAVNAFADAGDLVSDLRRRDPAWLPSRYETQFELAPGEYDLRVVLSDGGKVGRAEVPLTIESYDSKSLALSSIFLCRRFRDAHVADEESAAANFAPQYVPLVSKSVRVTPAGDTAFAPDEHLLAYFEIYNPKMETESALQTQAHIRIVEARSGRLVKEFPAVAVADYQQPGSSVVPIVREVPIATLPKGKYRLEIQASETAGRITPWRASNFTIR